MFAGFPQECGPSGHKEHFWDHVTKTMAKLPRRTSFTFGGDFNGDPIPDDAAIGWHHPCETLSDNGAHQRNMRGAALEPEHVVCAADAAKSELGRKHLARTQWSAKQARSHLALSRLGLPRVTVDFRSSQML